MGIHDVTLPGWQNGLNSSFLSCEKDLNILMRALFLQSQPYSNKIKRLLVANTPDCLDLTDSETLTKIDNMTLQELKDGGYIRIEPKIDFGEHEEVKSYLIFSFDGFQESSNPEFRDNFIQIDIMCDVDNWDMGGFRIRPLYIAGYIDGIINKTRLLTGIGRLEFCSCSKLVLSEHLAGYTLLYRAYHGTDDYISED